MLEKIRQWKLKYFADWQWDILVGGGLALVAWLLLLLPPELLILIIPFGITVINQMVNKIFEPKDFALRMAIPIVIFLIQQTI
jgi:hypothetical protein